MLINITTYKKWFVVVMFMFGKPHLNFTNYFFLPITTEKQFIGTRRKLNLLLKLSCLFFSQYFPLTFETYTSGHKTTLRERKNIMLWCLIMMMISIQLPTQIGYYNKKRECMNWGMKQTGSNCTYKILRIIFFNFVIGLPSLRTCGVTVTTKLLIEYTALVFMYLFSSMPNFVNSCFLVDGK